MVRFLISVPTALRDELKKVAREGGYTMTWLIRQILWEWVRERT